MIMYESITLILKLRTQGLIGYARGSSPACCLLKQTCTSVAKKRNKMLTLILDGPLRQSGTCHEATLKVQWKAIHGCATSTADRSTII